MAKKKTRLAGKRRPNAGSFKKGDPRINRNGPIKTNVLAFNRSLRELIVNEGESKHKDILSNITLKKVEWMVKVVWNAAIKGEAWAVQFIAERTEGKVTQPVDNPGLEKALYEISEKFLPVVDGKKKRSDEPK